MNDSNDHAACSGCSLCLLVCPMWRRYRDISLSAHGYAKALQQGAAVEEIAHALWSCSLCGACDPVCPEQIDLSGMILKLRRQLDHSNPIYEPQAAPASSSAILLLADSALRERPDLLARIVDLVGEGGKLDIAEDDSIDIALALEAGTAIPQQRLQPFLASLRGKKKVIVADGLLLKYLRRWLATTKPSGTKLASLGETLSNLGPVRRSLRADDLYVIEPRAYHADYQRLVKHYDRLRSESGSEFNLDLQRIAIPVSSRNLSQRQGLLAGDDGEQARWVLRGRNIRRIVLESMEDKFAFEKVSSIPVVHLAELG